MIFCVVALAGLYFAADILQVSIVLCSVLVRSAFLTGIPKIKSLFWLAWAFPAIILFFVKPDATASGAIIAYLKLMTGAILFFHLLSSVGESSMRYTVFFGPIWLFYSRAMVVLRSPLSDFEMNLKSQELVSKHRMPTARLEVFRWFHLVRLKVKYLYWAIIGLAVKLDMLSARIDSLIEARGGFPREFQAFSMVSRSRPPFSAAAGDLFFCITIILSIFVWEYAGSGTSAEAAMKSLNGDLNAFREYFDLLIGHGQVRDNP